MIPRKLSVFVVGFPYAGNGGSASLTPGVCDFLIRMSKSCAGDQRVACMDWFWLSDTPITMTRNRALELALEGGYDVLVMIDSDMEPDLYFGETGQKRFWDSSFDHLYSHYERGPVVLFAPYCGPNPHPIKGGESCVYIFQWTNTHNVGVDGPGLKIEMYSRPEAVKMAGIGPVAAAGTGLCMWDMRIIKHIPRPWFDYEWKDDGPLCPHCRMPKAGARSSKASTEDVVHTRDMALIGEHKLGYNPVLCNWDSWAGHVKSETVGRPWLPSALSVNHRFTEAIQRGENYDEKVVQISPEGLINDGRWEFNGQGKLEEGGRSPIGNQAPEQPLRSQALQQLLGGQAAGRVPDGRGDDVQPLCG